MRTRLGEAQAADKAYNYKVDLVRRTETIYSETSII